MPIPITLARFRAEVLTLYAPPLRAKLTCGKVRHVLDLVAELPGVRSPADLTPAAVATFARALLGRGLAPATVRGELAYLRAVCRYAVARGYLRSCPFAYRRDWLPDRGEQADADSPRRRHHPAGAIARVLALLEAEAAGGSWEAARLHALAALVAFTGLRKMEALTLRLGAIELERRTVRLGGAGRRLKTRGSAQPVPIPEALAAVLAGWVPLAGPAWAFPGVTRRGPWTGGPFGDRALDQLRAAGARAGVEGLTFLSLRHSWATHAESLWGLSGPTIRRVLRHATERTSERHYRHADEANLRAAVAGIAFAPSPAAAAG